MWRKYLQCLLPSQIFKYVLPRALYHFNVFTQSHYLALSQMHHFLFYLQEKAENLPRPSPPLWVSSSNCISSLSKQHHRPPLPKSANLGSILDSSPSLSTSNQLPNPLILPPNVFQIHLFFSIPTDFFCKLATALNWTCHFPAWNPQFSTSNMIKPRQSSPSPLDLALASFRPNSHKPLSHILDSCYRELLWFLWRCRAKSCCQSYT